METIKWGIIGCGDVTEVKSGPAFNQIRNSQLVAVMRRNAEKAKDYASRHKVPKWYSNANELINDAEVNAIYVATPPDAHAELTIKALQAKKPVYVEKPMARNYVECQKMMEASQTYNTPLYVAYYRRALPGFLKVKELLQSNQIGKIKVINARLHKSLFPEKGKELPWRVNPKIAGGGHFFDLASHQLDIFDFLFGPVQKVKAFALNQARLYKAEDIVIAGFEMPNKVLINSSYCFTVPEYLQEDLIEIIGEKGKISFSCFDFIPVKLETLAGKELFKYDKPKHVQQPFLTEVAQQLLGKKDLLPNADSAARTSLVMDEVVSEYYKNMPV